MRVIITGATGMVGEGVLHECLNHREISAVLVIGRKSCGYSHPKLKEIIHADFNDLSAIEDKLNNYSACFFCSGVTSIGKKEEEYTALTYTLTLNFAKTISKHNPHAIFEYISGAGTDSTEKGSSMWARVKGKTENDLMKLPFKRVYAVRPAFIKATPGFKYTQKFYKYIGWIYPIGRALFKNYFITLHELGQAMINAALNGYDKHVIEVKDIMKLSKREEVRSSATLKAMNA